MRAHAPGSVTGLYAPPPADDPEAPSRGASVAIRDGVAVEVAPAPETVVTVDGDRAAVEPVAGVLDALDATAAVDLRPEVPLGHGFGASGAATLATALAANAAFGLGREREALVAAAHRAELAAGTGQGDVFVQDRGGFVSSGSAGEIRRATPAAALEWTSVGPIDTGEVLADGEVTATAARVGPTHIDALGEAPSPRAFAERSRAYLEALGIATPFVEREIGRVEAAGGAGSMALFGETVFAVDVRDVLPNRTRVSTAGATLG